MVQFIFCIQNRSEPWQQVTMAEYVATEQRGFPGFSNYPRHWSFTVGDISGKIITMTEKGGEDV